MNNRGSVGKTARHRGQSTPPSLKARKTGPKDPGPVFLSLGSVSLKSAGAVPPSAAVKDQRSFHVKTYFLRILEFYLKKPAFSDLSYGQLFDVECFL